jgi:hypothetical protein
LPVAIPNLYKSSLTIHYTISLQILGTFSGTVNSNFRITNICTVHSLNTQKCNFAALQIQCEDSWFLSQIRKLLASIKRGTPEEQVLNFCCVFC